MSKCEKCGKEYVLSKQDKLLRKLIKLNAKLFPTLEVSVNQAENYCNDCWKKTVRPATESLLEEAQKE